MPDTAAIDLLRWRTFGRGGLFAAILCLISALSAAFSIPERNGWVTDQARILDQDSADALARRLHDIQHDTGDEVVVVTLGSLQGTSIEHWGNLLGETWQVGKANGKDNGVVLVVAPNDRQVRLAVGYGLSNRIPDSVAATIISDHILPYFRAGDFKAGIRAGIESIAIQLDPATPVAPPTRSTTSIWASSFSQLIPSMATVKTFVFWGVIVLVVLIVLIFNATNVGPRRRWNDYNGGWGNSGWGSSSSSSSWSSSSWSSSGGGSSGGGSSGGGGSFGGGASGSW